jgi:hypothetical protein
MDAFFASEESTRSPRNSGQPDELGGQQKFLAMRDATMR